MELTVLALCLMVFCAMLLNGIFSGAETGLYCMNQLRLRLEAERGDLASRRVLKLWDRASDTIVDLSFGVNLMTEVMSLAVLALLEAVQCPNAGLMTGLVAPLVLVILADLLPKNIFQSAPGPLMKQSSRTLSVAHVLFLPATILLSLCARGITALFGTLYKKGVLEGHAFSRHSLLFAVQEVAREGALSAGQQRLAQNILALKDTTAREAATPTDAWIAVHEGASYREVLALCRRSGYNLFPVYRDCPNCFIGATSLFDYFQAGGDQAKMPIRELPIFAPATDLFSVLIAMRDRNSKIGLVVETGGQQVGLFSLGNLAKRFLEES